MHYKVYTCGKELGGIFWYKFKHELTLVCCGKVMLLPNQEHREDKTPYQWLYEQNVSTCSHYSHTGLYANALLFRLPTCALHKLQFVQNSRMIPHSEKHAHITHVLIDLHWLPFQYHVHNTRCFSTPVNPYTCVLEWTSNPVLSIKNRGVYKWNVSKSS